MRSIAFSLWLLFFVSLLAAPAVAAEPVDYVTRIKPLLTGRCYACHGALKQEGDLRLDTAATARKGGGSGPALVAGKAAESFLIERISDKDLATRMPPENEGVPFNAEEISLIRTWIDQGANGPADEKPESDPREHWAFRSPMPQAIPTVKHGAWPKGPLDSFIAAEHDRLGLVPQIAADKRVLLRRVYLDLIGLPPSAVEQEAFVADTSVDAYDRIVERLIASPQYGERWGRHWMDIWRYSDWWGLGAEVRNSQKHIWHWRDWIVESLNRDVGYDEMVRQMLAADELYPDDLERLRATGFLARQYFKFNRNTWLEGTVEHTFKAMIGMTVNCCRCHDHKYDPISQVDYFRLRAFFEPYQVRTDQIPGEADYEKDGIPRVFDCNLDAPTYRFVRGDEKNPVTDRPLTPAIPGVLAFDDLKISPRSLPPTSHQPGLRPWVLGNHLANAERQVATAREALEKARNVLAAAAAAKPKADVEVAQKNEPNIDLAAKKTAGKSDADELAQLAAKPAAPKISPKPPDGIVPLVKDDFTVPQPDVWEQIGGKWRFDGQRLVQYDDVQSRSVLRLKQTPPLDFQATLKFAIIGGRTYRSVGVAFDVDGSNELLVYLSAYANEPKLQITYKRNGMSVYPPEAKLARPVKLDEMHELTIRVRGPLVNVELNGQHVLAWSSPLPRRTGKLDLITFDAQASYTGFELSPLPASVKLADAAAKTVVGPSTKLPSPELAAAEVKIAELALAIAELQTPLAQARFAADTAQHNASQKFAELAQAAARLEKESTAAKANEDVARAELAVLKVETAKRADAEKKLAAARDAIAKAVQEVGSPGAKYTSLTGALKTLESNLETEDHRRLPFPKTSSGRRAALADWLTDARHPLTARVAVNHIWSRHFGRPLVANVFEFGRKGTPPTHPALLDFLATDFLAHGWDMKHLHRQMVTSQTYQLSSSMADFGLRNAELKPDSTPKPQSIDPENKFLWRMNPTRMEAQVVRDNLLHLSGELETKMGGPSLDPVINEMSRRRSLYFVHSHNEHHKFLSIFDDANVLDCYRRDQSIVPQQALALSNSKQSFDAAAKIAEQLSSTLTSQSDDIAFIQAAFTTMLATRPTADEQQACREALAAWNKTLSTEKTTNAAQQARTNLIHALLNHNDFVTVR